MPRHKDVVSVGSSLRDLKAFPLDARRAVGFQLDLLQQGEAPCMSFTSSGTPPERRKPGILNWHGPDCRR